MSAFSLKPISVEDQDDLRADARSEMFFALRKAFSERQKQSGIKAKDLSEILCKNKSYVSRVLNGTQESIDYETLYVFLHALGYHLSLEPTSFEELSCKRKNSNASPSWAVDNKHHQPNLYATRFKGSSNTQQSESLRAGRKAPRIKQISKEVATH